MNLVYEVLTHLLRLLFFWLPPLRVRINFENKNKTEPLAQSFARDGVVADIAFEFSSEGEFQQIGSLVADSLREGKKVELIFFSPSVEKTVLDLAKNFPKQIRYLRYPIATLGFRKWITSKNLVLVRYDLFPEFLFWAGKKENTLKMVWVSFKRERLKKKKISWMKKAFLKKSKKVVFASVADKDYVSPLGIEGSVYDFRIEQIHRRIRNKTKTFEEKFFTYPDLLKALEQVTPDKRLIMGNAWPVDLHLLKNLPEDFVLVVVPHQLKPEILDSFRERLKGMGRAPVEINDSMTAIPEAKTYILNKKGVLCELYHDFPKAYVGGGFGVSIHSVLEPLVAGSERISCGPVHQRSTEYDVAQDFGRITEVNNSDDFTQWLLADSLNSGDHGKLNAIISSYEQSVKDILTC